MTIDSNATYLLLFGANLTFIVTHLYSWLLKWFYRPKAYSENFGELFPAYRAVGALYLMQVLEVPYLLQVGNADALLYVNAFALLLYTLQMIVICECYFFPNVNHRRKDYCVFIPAAVASGACDYPP